MPTLSEINKEILTGPLCEEISPFLTMVFNDVEPTRSKLLDRQGKLTPDGAFAIMQILNDPTKRLNNHQLIPKENFVKVIVPLVIGVASLSEQKQVYWGVLLKDMLERKFIDISNPQLNSILDIAVKDELITSSYKNEILNLRNVETQSRLSELGWTITIEEIQNSIKEE